MEWNAKRNLIGATFAVSALILSSSAGAATLFFEGTGGAIPDRVSNVTPGRISSSVTASNSFAVTGVSVTIRNLTHAFAPDVDIFLTHGSTTIELSTDNGARSPLNGTFTFDDASITSAAGLINAGGIYRPENPLGRFNGSNSAGLWTLRIDDDTAQNSGAFSGWTLCFPGGPSCYPGASNAVPEPANWALMIAGFGLVGSALRSGNGRRRQRVAVKVTYA